MCVWGEGLFEFISVRNLGEEMAVDRNARKKRGELREEREREERLPFCLSLKGCIVLHITQSLPTSKLSP